MVLGSQLQSPHPGAPGRAQDPDLIRAIAEQVTTPTSQMHGWKVIIAVRSPNDPVLRAVTGLPVNMREEPLILRR